MKKVIVTGGTGYIGSNLVRKLMQDGVEVYLILREESKLTLLEDCIDKLLILRYDMELPRLIDFLNQIKPDMVFHLASCFIAAHKPEDVDLLAESNLVFGMHLLEAMKQTGVKKLVNTGTVWQHFEEKEYNPVCLYAATKEAFERIMEYYRQAENFDIITMMLCDTYGEGDPRGKVVQLLKKIARSGETLAMSGGEQYLDLVYINDVIEDFLLAAKLLEKKESHLSRYYVRSGRAVTLRELARIYESVNAVKLNIEWGERPYRNREVMQPCYLGEGVQSTEHRISLEDGLHRVGEQKVERKTLSTIDFESAEADMGYKYDKKL